MPRAPCPEHPEGCSSPDFPNPQHPHTPGRPIFGPMLAVLLALLSVAAGLSPRSPADATTEAGTAPATEVAEGADACCGAEVGDAEPSHPCVPGESCPPSGGCCACVSCSQRLASAPPSVSPEEAEDATRRGVPAGTWAGIDGGDAVWHPPRG